MNPKRKTNRLRRIGAAKILKPREFKALLRNATPQTLPAFVLGGFTSLRMGEIMNLDWRDVNFEQKQLLVHGGKYSSRKRLVSLPDVAVAWLAPIAKESGRVMDGLSAATLSAQMRCVWKEAKCAATPHCLRYSSVAYRLALEGGTKTAAEFGFSLKMLIALFRHLVRKRQAKAWFSIFPPIRP